MRILTALLSALTAVFVGGCFEANAQNAPVAIPLKSVPTFSTANIAREGHFYVGGKWVGEPGKEYMRGAMYVEVWVPKEIRYNLSYAQNRLDPGKQAINSPRRSRARMSGL